MDRKTIEALKKFVKFLEDESNRDVSSQFMTGVMAGHIDSLDEFKRIMRDSGCTTPTEYVEITGEWEEGAEL